MVLVGNRSRRGELPRRLSEIREKFRMQPHLAFEVGLEHRIVFELEAMLSGLERFHEGVDVRESRVVIWNQTRRLRLRPEHRQQLSFMNVASSSVSVPS